MNDAALAASLKAIAIKDEAYATTDPERRAGLDAEAATWMRKARELERIARHERS